MNGRRVTGRGQRPGRVSNLLVPLSEARRRIDRARFHTWPVTWTSLDRAVGLLSAATVRARHDVPVRPRAAMDGFAVARPGAGPSGRYRRVAGEIRPGGRLVTLARGTAVAVNTGAPVPRGAVAVVRSEWALTVGAEVRVRALPRAGQDIQPPGEDLRRGTVLLRRGDRVGPYHLGLLRSQGMRRVRVYRPRVVVLAIGDELRTGRRREGKVEESITPVLAPLLRFGRVRVAFGISDEPAELRRALAGAVAAADLVVTIGGTSVGPHDRTKAALASIGRLLFAGVRVSVLKRGAVGQVRGVPVVVLPGQVGSALTTWHEHGLHVVGRITGHDLRAFESARLAAELDNPHRMDTVYLFRLTGGLAAPARWGAHRAFEFLRANAFGVVPRRSVLGAGAEIRVQRLEGSDPAGG
jgi:molybdopterin molybdotransferase